MPTSIESEPKMQTATTTAAARQPLALPGIRRLVLTGFMGAGKSTIGRLLAAELGYTFLDLDTLIEERTGQTIAAIFAEQGEAAFRRIESHALAVALGRSNVVIALGGGAPEQLTNRLLLEQTPGTLTVYLHAPFDALVARCAAQEDAAIRPNLADPIAAENRFRQRLPHYQRLAGHTLDTTPLTREETIAALLSHLSTL